MDIGQKIRHIRVTEELKQTEFAKETGIKLRTLRGYESGERKGISVGELLKITNHPRFKKYTLLLMTDDNMVDGTAEEAVEFAVGDDEFAKLFEKLSDEKAEQTIEYMKFLLAQEQKQP